MTCMARGGSLTKSAYWTRETWLRLGRSKRLAGARTTSLADLLRSKPMSKRYLAVGIFIIAGVTLFALGIFLVGSRHEAFAHHVLLYTEFANLDGVTKGSKVQVAGMDAGQVARIDVPNSPNGRFRVQMKVDDRFHGLVRTDSV